MELSAVGLYLAAHPPVPFPEPPVSPASAGNSAVAPADELEAPSGPNDLTNAWKRGGSSLIS